MRRDVMAVVVVPLLACLTVGTVLAWSAEMDRSAAERHRREITDLVALGEVDAAVSAELSLYRTWIDEAESGRRAERAGNTLITDRGNELAAAIRAQVDQAVEGLDVLSRSASATVSPTELRASLAEVRAAWDARDLDRVRLTLERADREVLEPLGPAATTLAEGTTDLTLIADVAKLVASMIDEGAVTATALNRGWLEPGERDGIVVAVDRTDRAVAAIAPRLPPDLGGQLVEIRDEISDGPWAEARASALALPDGPGSAVPLDQDRALRQLVATAAVTREIGRIGRGLADLTSAEVAAEANGAARRRDLAIGLVLVAVGLSSVVTVRNGRTLTRRIDDLATEAALIAQGDLSRPTRRPARHHGDELDELGAVIDELRTTVDTTRRQVVALAEGRFDDPVLETELPGVVGAGLRVDLRRLELSAAELARRARHDPLTDLLTHTAFVDTIEARIASGVPVSVVYVDLDDFKPVNDAHGHEAGNEVLTAVAARLRGLVRDADDVARLGGDEFAVAQVTDDPSAVQRLMDRVIERLAEPIGLRNGATVRVGASVGGVTARPGLGGSQLLDEADRQMYAAKRAGKNRTVLLG